MLVINNSGDMTLYRIGLDGGQASLSVVASIKFDQGVSVGVGHSGELITTSSPCPFIVHELTTNRVRNALSLVLRSPRPKHQNGSNIHITKVDHHNDEMSLETTIRPPRRRGSLHADGQGYVIGLFAQIRFEPLWVVIGIHFDHPGIVVRFDGWPTFTPMVDRLVSNLHFVTFPPPT